MKRIILWISVLLMLVQNGFAKTDAEFDKQISNATMKVNKQIFRCNKEAENNSYNGNLKPCLQALNILHKEYPNEKVNTAIMYLNAGTLYYHQSNMLKAYEYYIKSAKLGNTNAQYNLNILCKESPWACK